MSDKYEAALSLIMELSPAEKQQLLEQVAVALRENKVAEQSKPQRSPWAGICADLGPAPSAEEIDEVQRDMWKNFPREDI